MRHISELIEEITDDLSLTAERVRAIRVELSEDSRRGRKLAIAEREGVSLSTIENLWQGRTWARVGDL